MTQPSTTAPAARLPYRTITVAQAAAQGMAPAKMTAEAMHAWLPEDGTLTPVWEREGNVHGVVLYGIHHFRRYACDTTGTAGVEIVREDGTVVIRFPMGQGRSIRLLGKARA